jgi:hypothetical protein
MVLDTSRVLLVKLEDQDIARRQIAVNNVVLCQCLHAFAHLHVCM